MPITRPLVLRVECAMGSKVTGSDSAILHGSEPLLTVAEEALPVMLRPVLAPLSHQLAAKIGETLHHAEWTITNDPEVVEKVGMHDRPDCVRCRAGVDQALTHLREAPDRPMIVGILHWAGTRPSEAT